MPFKHLQWQQVSLVLTGQYRLRDISFSLNEKGTTAIMGHNGAGKTLLLQLCAGLFTPSSGSILWNHQPSLAPRPPQLTLVPQTPVLLKGSVADNILKPLRYHQHKRQHRREHADKRCQQALAWAGIEHLQQRAAQSLSTGERQLVALARAWALQPSILLLDEPCANLDPHRQQQLDQLIEQLSQHCKIIISTHSTRQAQDLAADILLLQQGKLVAHLENQAFFESAAFQQFC